MAVATAPIRLLLLAMGCLLAVACGQLPISTPVSSEPPPVIVRGGGNELALRYISTCWMNFCADGAAPETAPDIGDAEEIEVGFPLAGWTFQASVTSNDDGRVLDGPLEPVTVTKHRLRPIGPAGHYLVGLFGSGPLGPGGRGDIFVAFEWHTPVDGVFPEPWSKVSIVSDAGGQLRNTAVEFYLTDLARTPDSASVELTVTSSEGNSETLALGPPRERGGGSEGDLYLENRNHEAAPLLGSPPFLVEATVTLDGGTYTGVGIWPDDVDPEDEPYVQLRFSPPLPALGGEG
jgi:hypothetical protein